MALLHHWLVVGWESSRVYCVLSYCQRNKSRNDGNAAKLK